MKRTLLCTTTVAALAIAAWLVAHEPNAPQARSPAATRPEPPRSEQWVEQPYLAAMHAEQDVDCKDCHGAELIRDDSHRELNRKCMVCHDTLASLAHETEGPLNPHRSHLGTIECTVCHSAHQPSNAYCQNCHAFVLDIPHGKPLPSAPSAPSTYTSLHTASGQSRHRAAPEETDVVVIGSGGAGLTAAIEAHDTGARVVVLEKQPLTGGNTMLAAGGMNAAGTPQQRQRGIDDSPQKMFDDTLAGGKYQNDRRLARILAERSAASLDWLTQLGAKLDDVGRLGGSSVPRSHRPRSGSVGSHVVSVLRRAAEERKIDVRLRSKVVQILLDKSRGVMGVVVQGHYSGRYVIHVRSIVLASGGFSANPKRVADYRPQYAQMTNSNQPGTTGDSIAWAEQLGIQLRDMDKIQVHPTLAAEGRILVSEALRGCGAILVNNKGQRFVNEMTTRDKVSDAILAQDGATAWLVFDQRLQQRLSVAEGYKILGMVVEADSIDQLAERIGTSGAELKKTLQEYRQAANSGHDAAFGRTGEMPPIDGPGFCAIHVRPGLHYTMGGVKIDERTRVIATSGQPIAGLFAAGEATGGVHGANRLGGNSVSETITFGLIAGREAVSHASRSPGKSPTVPVSQPAEPRQKPQPTGTVRTAAGR